MRELSLFSGGGGGVYGSKLLGWKTIGYVEYDDYCQRIIAQRIRDGVFDYAPIFGDIRTFATQHAAKYRGLVDVITAGFPCQPFSTAGNARGTDDERNMWPQTLEVIRAIRPQYALLENVPGLLGQHRYFETILKDLSEAGYDASWVCLSAAEVGAPHKRERLWILGYANNNGFYEPQNSKSSNERDDSSEKGSKESLQLKRSGNVGQDVCGGSECYLASRSARYDRQAAKWWATEPNVGRVADGVADRKYRLKALGNGQVPAVFAEAWRVLNEQKH
jgi:DNA (cytosine-5)-methyltransferase 1